MARIRAKLKQRVLFMALNVILVMLGFQIVRGEEYREWKQVQREFKELHLAALNGQIENADSDTPTALLEQWRRTAAEVAASKPKIQQTYLPEAGVHDLCTTCHLGIENPLFTDAKQPFRTHPGAILKTHKVDKFGCTLCHQGLGVGTTLEAAHGLEENWHEPLIPTEYAQSTCVKCHESPFMLDGAEKLDHGRKLFLESGCYACHGGKNFASLPMFAAPLGKVTAKIANASWLARWIEEPAALQANTAMPHFYLNAEESGDIAAFLVALDGQTGLTGDKPRGGDADSGQALFVERGCRGCHSAAQGEPGASSRVPNLSDTGLKLRADWIMDWLEDPRAYNPDSRMPKPSLTESERRDLTAYLMSLQTEAAQARLGEAVDLSAHDAERGRELVQDYGCYACHAIPGFEDSPAPGVEIAQVAHKRLEDLPFGESDVAHTKWDWISAKIASPRIYRTEDTPLKMPLFTNDDEAIEALTAYYLNNERYELAGGFLPQTDPHRQAIETGDELVNRYNCRGCHMLEEGQQPLIAAHLSRNSLVPPRLVGEGEKVQPQWLYDFLNKPTQLRPWLTMQMPEFGFSSGETESLARYFAELSADAGISYPYVTLPTREDMTDEEFEMGAYRIQLDKCSQCHPLDAEAELPPGTNLDDISINLMLAKSRLRFEWFKNFLRNPDRYAGAGTKMPFIYYDPAGKPKIPDAEMWIDLTARFLMVADEVPKAKDESLSDIRPGSDTDWTSY